MEIELKGISFGANIYDIKEEFARILHSDAFRHATRNADQEYRPLNFDIELNGRTENILHNGTGKLILPSRGPGQKLLQLATEGVDFPSINSRRILMRDSGFRPSKASVEKVRKVPFQDPDIEREHDSIVFRLGTSWRIEKLQIGTWLHRPVPHCGREHHSVFAVEWDRNYVAEGNAHLSFDYDRKLLRLDLGEPASDIMKYHAVIKFSNIRQIWTGYEFKPYICFDTHTPPIFESENINRTLTGNRSDARRFRQRVCALDEGHRRVQPYAYQVRVVLYGKNDLDDFLSSCTVAGLRRTVMANITSEHHHLFSSRRLLEFYKSFKIFQGLPWTVLFQIEALLHNGLLTTVQYLEGLLPCLKELAISHPTITGTLLRDFSQVLQAGYHCHLDSNDVTDLFKGFRDNRLEDTSLEVELQSRQLRQDSSLMACHHVTFTPTRMLLEGPYAIQSNRVLRHYNEFHDYFLRVDFRDEDRLQFQWDHEVDGTTFLQQRVGGILKHGFVLAGRHFDFLAYSSSALRDHSVWFVSPFSHHLKGKVTAASIRKEIGDLSGTLDNPAKFAARLALAFSGTNSSVKIKKHQWREIPDIGTKPYLHTDGVGTISKELGHLIWGEECRSNPGLSRFKEPSAYQIRFLGYKGVVVVDESLSDIQMRLRESMRKFTAHDAGDANIEIANAFYTPSSLYLNQPLVMILEDRGAKKEAFMNLLDAAVADTYLTRESLKHFISAMKSHGLGSTFGLTDLFRRLSSYNLDLGSENAATNFRTPFVDKLIDCTMASILRDIQYRCRIPVPQSHTLVGVADEGQAWIDSRKYAEEEVFTLGEGEIFACIQKDAESEPIYLERSCIIFRSPMLYPGDVQMVWAIGKPPHDKICAFRNLVNVVVFPSKGKRSLASSLSGGDLDGDIFNICQCQPIFGNIHDFPAEFRPPSSDYPGFNPDVLKEVDPETGEVKIYQEKIIPYVCDFIVKYINSDVLGVLADLHLIRADQSMEGVRDEGCLRLAELCNQAVDYPKNGQPVDVSNLPARLIKYKPDWKKNEADDERRTDFYRSERAIGEIFRKAEEIASSTNYLREGANVFHQVLDHPIYIALRPVVEAKIRNSAIEQTTTDDVRKIFRRYYHELSFICTTHTLTDRVDTRLKEEEVVVGTILARCSRHRRRTERIYRMRVHMSNLVKDIRGQFISRKLEEMSMREVTKALEFAWTSWKLITDELSTDDARKDSFGLNSFSFLALNVVLECLEHLDKLGVDGVSV